MIKHDLLHSFQLVAKLGGISKAADKRSLSVMALSKQMSKLEEQVGQPLFERTGRSMRLTEFGKLFNEQANKVLLAQSSLDNWLEDSKGQVTGKLRVLTQSSDIMDETIIPWLKSFLQQFPKLDVELDVKESLININDDDYDVFWGIGDYLGDQFPNLKRRQLWQSKLGIYASPEYLQEYGEPTNPNELEHHYVIGYLYNQPTNVMVLQDNNEVIYKLLKQRVATVSGLIDLAIDGLGIVNVGDDIKQVMEAVEQHKLLPILTDYWWQDAHLYVYFHNVRHAQPKVKAFIDFFLDKRSQWN